ncbi:UNVERIFIED_CONTAM: hypothetical protein ACS92_05655 [Bacillus cereus]
MHPAVEFPRRLQVHAEERQVVHRVVPVLDAQLPRAPAVHQPPIPDAGGPRAAQVRDDLGQLDFLRGRRPVQGDGVADLEGGGQGPEEAVRGVQFRRLTGRAEGI